MATKTHLTLYRDKTGDWRWRAQRSGRIVADSGEGYRHRGDCVCELASLILSFTDGHVSLGAGLKGLGRPPKTPPDVSNVPNATAEVPARRSGVAARRGGS